MNRYLPSQSLVQFSLHALRFHLVLLLSLPGLLTAQESTRQKFNPQTVMLSRFTFVRPDNWHWMDTKFEGSNLLQIVVFEVEASGQAQECRAYFNHFIPDRPAGSPKAVAKRWNELFLDLREPVSFSRPQTIGKNKVSYIELAGAYRVENSKSGTVRSGYALYGAVIEDDAGNIVMRLLGPAAAVENAKPVFKKMIADALGTE